MGNDCYQRTQNRRRLCLAARVSYVDLADHTALAGDEWRKFLTYRLPDSRFCVSAPRPPDFSRRGWHFLLTFRFFQFSLSDCSSSVVPFFLVSSVHAEVTESPVHGFVIVCVFATDPWALASGCFSSLLEPFGS